MTAGLRSVRKHLTISPRRATTKGKKMPKSLSEVIPMEFYNTKRAGKPHPQAVNVGDLIKQLQRIPAHLPLFSYAANGCDIVVANISEPEYCCVIIEELD